ncbi:hypothetical protein [Okeania sp.]|uniref:hypothetical protein n=1 Tax=Okeania sp. TaxID=3100323 RepID=UPI002B4B1DCC|nr:hypothetical protein [Okeania sp.]MEB3339774.1 hypothetical protein [Okeania sp.]
MQKIITILGISAVLVSLTTIAKAQSNNIPTGATISGDSLRTVEDRSIINDDNYRIFIAPSESSNPTTKRIKTYELRRQQQTVEVVPGFSIPVNPDKTPLENPVEENNLNGDKSEEGFTIELGI